MKKAIIMGFALALIVTGCTLSRGNKQSAISLDDAKKATADFINNYLMQPGSTVTVKEITEENGLYKATVVLPDGSETTSYLSEDGATFFPQAMDIADYAAKAKTQTDQQQAATAQSLNDIPKQDKAEAQLFVMGFCPYGVQAEQAMAPVVDLLGDKADIKIRYIVSVPGDDLAQVQSLHGTLEGYEDARQLCIAENYDTTTLWNYVKAIDNDCYPIYRNGDDAYEVCWKKAAVDAKINTAKIDSCVSNEGVGLIKAEDQNSQSNGVSGSPTLIINGVKYSGSRTPDAFKDAICAGFTNPPEECSQTLSTTAAAASGNCN